MEASSDDKHAPATVTKDGVVYAVTDGSIKVIGTSAEVEGPRLVSRLAELRIEIAALEAEEALAAAALAAGPAAVAEARAIEGRVAAATAELATSEQRTASAAARVAAGRERLARLKERS